jgi:ribosomal protein S27AE
MTLQNAPRTAVSGTPRLKLPTCPLCGDMLLAPMMAEHVSERLVRNHWACESCGYTFRRSFEFEPRRELVCDA